MAECQRGYHAYAWHRHETTGDFVGLGQTSNLAVELALLLTNLLVDHRERLDHGTELVVLAQQIGNVFSELRADGPSEQQSIFLDHAADLVLDVPTNADET